MEEFPRMEPELGIKLKQFDALNALLGEQQKGLIRGTSATAGFILLGIGWFVSAKDSAPFLKEHPHFLWAAALAPVLGSFLYGYVAWLVHKRSQNIVAALRRFVFMPSEIYENSVVSRGQFLVFSGGILLLSVIFGGCIYFAGNSSQDDDEDEVFMRVEAARPMHTPMSGSICEACKGDSR
jgi:hypothetical protein